MNKEEDYTQAAMKMLNKRMEPKIRATYKKLEERFKNKEL